MTKFAIALAASAAALFSTAAVAAPGEQRVSYEGQTYSYLETATPTGSVIDGRNLTTGAKFHLVVRGEQVSGYANGVPVSYRVDRTPRAAKAVQLASR